MTAVVSVGDGFLSAGIILLLITTFLVCASLGGDR